MHTDPIMRRIHACVLAGVPVFLVGSPGTGKTARVKAYTRARELHLERWLLSRCEAIDLKPRVYTPDGKVSVIAPPEIDRLVAAAAAAQGRIAGVSFYDELNLAERSVEGAALDLIDAPPDGVAVIAAGNPPSRGQAARSLGAAAANRFCHVPVGADPSAWAAAQIQGWSADTDADAFPSPMPAQLAASMDRARALASAFIRKMPDWLEKEPSDPVSAGRAWPSTRTWDNATRLHAACMALAMGPEDTRELIAGCVGDGAAVAYLAYVQDADLPDPEDLLANPTSYVPDAHRVDRTVVALTAVAGALSRKLTDDRWTAAWQLAGVVTQADQASAAMMLGDLLMRTHRAAEKAGVKLTSPPTLIRKYAPRMAQILAPK